jgi:hypothetical protein
MMKIVSMIFTMTMKENKSVICNKLWKNLTHLPKRTFELKNDENCQYDIHYDNERK